MAKVKLKITKSNNTTYDIDKFNGLKNFESLSQSTPDASSFYYGTLANSGSAEIIDIDGSLKSLIDNEDITNSNTPVDIYINDKLEQKHITNDSDYTTDNVLSLHFTNNIDYWDKANYAGYAYNGEMKTAYDVLYDVLYSLGLSQPIDSMLSEQIVYGSPSTIGTIKSYLEAITIPYPYLPSDTYRNTIDKICRLAQLQVFQADDGNIKFISARPIATQTQLNNIIVVPKYAQIKKFNNSVILKNKYDAVEISENNVYTKYEYDSPINAKVVLESYTFGSATYDGSVQIVKARADVYYSTGTIFIPKTEDLGKVKYVSLGENKDFSSNNYSKYFILKNGTIDLSEVLDKLADTNTPLDYQTMKGLYIRGGETREGEKYSNGNICLNVVSSVGTITEGNYFSAGFYAGYNKTTKTFVFSSTSYGASTGAEVRVPDNSSLTITEAEGGYNVAYSILSKIIVCGNNIGNGSSGSRDNYIVSQVEAKQADIIIYGDKEILVFEDVSASDDVSNAKVIARVNGSELLQTGTMYNNSVAMSTLIKNNIKNDYENGISNGSLNVFCLDFYNTSNNRVLDFSSGQVLEVNNILSIEGNNKFWRIRGRNLKYEGQVTNEIQVEELKIITIS